MPVTCCHPVTGLRCRALCHEDGLSYFPLQIGQKLWRHVPYTLIVLCIQDQGSVPEVVCVNGSQMKEPCKPEVNEYQNRNQINDGVGEAFRNTTSSEPELEMQNLENEHFSNDVLEGIDGPQNMVVNDHSVVYSEKELTCKNVAEKVQDDAQLRMVSSRAESDLHGMTNVAKFEMSLLVPPNPPFGTSFVQGCCAFEPAWNIKGRYDRIDRGILHGGNRYQD
ncbi:hypothetical protein V6N12_067023 [Hibiscus sabdariffa]|uniref:Uncharacterized protein n=1 Tax=Hibiscus sabdariffa TaxID=183260 RepID=A0ABR2BKL0_9ROSI